VSDNPPAFPRTGEGFVSPQYDTPGMTLRDWFAGKALSGITADPETGADFDPDTDSWNRWAADIAEVAYGIADAMLAQRELGFSDRHGCKL
jgi:hypothetical protein